MNTKQSVTLYAAASLLLLIDCALLNGIEYSFPMFLYFGLPILGISALMVLVCVLLWKKSVQLSKDDIFFFVVYNAAFPFCIFSGAVLLVILSEFVF